MNTIRLAPAIIGFFLFVSVIAPTSGHGERQGYITVKTCPHSCDTERLNRKRCKDWREGDLCYVEDLSRPRQHELRPPHAPLPTPPQPNAGTAFDSVRRTPDHDSDTDEDAKRARCEKLRRGYLPRPRVTIEGARKAGNLLKDKYKVWGTVEGVCLIEAGYFEEGRKSEAIPVATDPAFQRFEFDLLIRSGRSPEVRVYNINGDRDLLEVDPSRYTQ